MGVKTAPRGPYKKEMGANATVAKALVRPEYSKYVEMDIEGLKHIEAMRAASRRESRSYERPDSIVGVFGIVEESGFIQEVAWKITGSRKDKRHGAVDPVEPISAYGKDLMASMFKGWHDEAPQE